MINRFIKKQSWIKVLVFQIITFGIYGIFWIKNIRLDAKEKGKENVINNSLITLYSIFVVIGIITMIAIYLLSYLWISNPEMISKDTLNMVNLINSLTNVSWILMITLAFQCRKYLKETYGVQSNAFLTVIFSIIQLQYKICEEYDKIESNNSSSNEMTKNETVAKKKKLRL